MRQARESLGQHGELQFARHAHLFLHLLGALLQLPGTLGQGQFRALAQGDVARHPERADDPAGAVAQGHLGRGHPSHASIGPGFLFLDAHQRIPGAHDLAFVRQRLFGVLEVEKVSVRLAYEIRGVLDAEPLGLRPIDAQKAALRVLEIDAVRDVIHQHL